MSEEPAAENAAAPGNHQKPKDKRQVDQRIRRNMHLVGSSPRFLSKENMATLFFKACVGLYQSSPSKQVIFDGSGKVSSNREVHFSTAALSEMCFPLKSNDSADHPGPLPRDRSNVSSQHGVTNHNLKVSVDEVELTFHATDTHGLSVNDLRLDELRLLDNGHSPRRFVRFESQRDLPIRAGILLDTSSSMQQNRPADQAIAIAYVQRVLDQKTDQAFIMSFGQRSSVRQAWSNNAQRSY